MRIQLFKDKVFLKKLVSLTLPIAFQYFMLASVAAGDAVMLGRVEQNSMSAVSLATQIQFVQNMVLTTVTGAGTILGAQYWGKGDRRTVEDIFSLILRINGAVSLAFFAGCFFFPETLMRLYASDAVLIEIGASYLRIASWSYLLTGVSQCCLSIMKITGHAARSAWISSGAVVLNIALNAVFIFGLIGKAMGADGAALATVIARAVELLWAAVSTMEKDFVRPPFGRFFRHIGWLSRDFWKCALPILGASLLWGIGFTAYTAVMGHLGTDPAAANSIASVVRDLMCCFCNGVASAGGILVGNELGSGNLERGRIYGDRLAVLSALIGLFSCAVILALTPLVVRFVILTDEARRMLTGIMVIMAVYMIARCVCTVVINGIFAAGGDTLFDMYSLAVAMWGIALPMAFLGAFVFHWPVLVVYGCTCLDEIGKLPWVFAHFARHKWVRDLTRSEEEKAEEDSGKGRGSE
ncbi:MAG: MATE family efflux transporter [Ruminococcaceae bacterium]|nr:MATE family efflux transporter [Oscillospiraceae bacterium]